VTSKRGVKKFRVTGLYIYATLRTAMGLFTPTPHSTANAVNSRNDMRNKILEFFELVDKKWNMI